MLPSRRRDFLLKLHSIACNFKDYNVFCVLSYVTLSRTFLTATANSDRPTGFIKKAFTPIDAAVFLCILSLNPVPTTTGISGDIACISFTNWSPVICGILISVNTSSYASGSAAKVSRGSDAARSSSGLVTKACED